MTDVATEDVGDRLDPSEAFKILGNETRLAILRALYDVRDRHVGFSDLRKRVGMRDGPQFNYHLDRLERGFVGKSAEGYYIRHAGISLLRALAAGTFTDHPRRDLECGGTCVVCGGRLQARYDHEMVFVECGTCDRVHDMGPFAPGGLVDRADEAVLAAYDALVRSVYALALAWVCHVCNGVTARTGLHASGRLPDDVENVQIGTVVGTDHGPGAIYQCERCDEWCYLTVGEHLLFEPAVVVFHRDHGVDLDRVPRGELDWCLPAGVDRYVAAVSVDPLRLRVTLPLDDEALVVTLDDEFAVVEAVREARQTSADG